MYRTLIGIDPGKTGAITHIKLDDKGQAIGLPVVVKMPDYNDLNDYIRLIGSNDIERTLCFIEKLSFRPGDMGGGKAFMIEKMMKNYNYLTAALVANKIGFIEVHPRTWQSQLKLTLPRAEAKLETKTIRKNRYKDFAQQQFTTVKCTLWNCDALLIMYFGWTKVQFDRDYLYKHLPDIDLDLLF